MSSKKSDKSKKSVKDDKTTEDQTTDNSSVPETVVEKPTDLRTILITIHFFKNIVPLYPVSDIKVSLKYLDQELGQSQIIPVTDVGKLVLNESFELTIDLEVQKQLDLLASNPIFISVIQSSGSMESSLYEQLQKSEEVPKPVEDVESLFSIYEAFTGERPSVQITDLKKKKKGKKEKPAEPAREKNKSRSKSIASKDSKHSKKSKGSKVSTKTASKSVTEAPVIKSEVYGMCVIDLIPLFYGETSFSETLIIKPIKKSCQILSTFKNFPDLFFTIAMQDNSKLIDLRNILNFTVESICNVPSLMYTDMDCRVCVMLPLQNNGASPTLFSNPKLTSRAPNKEVPKRWPGIHDIGYNANTTKYLIDTEFGNIINKSNLELQEAFKEESIRLEFNYLKRNILFKSSNSDFAAHILTHRKLVVEIFLTPKTKKRHDDHVDEVEELSHQRAKSSKVPPYLHLMAVVDVIALLYPGMSSLHAAAPITTFTYEEAAKNGLEDSFFIPKPKMDLAAKSSKTKLDTARKKKGDKKEKVSKKDKSSTVKEDKNLASQLPPKPEEPVLPEPSVQVYNEEGKPCFIIVEIELLKSINPKRDVEELKSELHQLQMQALQTSKTILNKNVADDLYSNTIREIIDDLNKHWINYNILMIKIPKPEYAGFQEYLQKVGAYQTYINSLTTSATLLITNKYKCDEKDFKNSKGYQNLISELYIDLISQMHGIVNSLVCTGMKPLGQKYSTSAEVSFYYAKEVAELKLYTTADRYFMERIINDEKAKAEFWFDYAIYNIEIKNYEKAFECAKESIAMKCKEKYALLLYGVLLAEKDDMHNAEICLLNILILESKWVEGWCVLYLFYQKFSRLDGMEMALDMGRKLFDDVITTDYFLEFEDLAWSSKNIPNTFFFRTAVLLLKMRLYSWVEMALAEEVLVPKHYGYVNYLLAVVSYYKREYDHAWEHIKEAKKYLGADFATEGLAGHILFRQSKLVEAQNAYLRVIESFDRPDDIHIIYLNCANILLQLGDDQKARKLILLTCKYHQTPHVWFSLGKVYFLENDMLSAEECFNEANQRDNRHAEVWGYLALVNLKLNRIHEAEQCYQQAVRSKLEDDHLLKAIVEGFNKITSLD